MTLSTRVGFSWVTTLAVAGLLAGCQSSRTAFQFAPAAPYTGTVPPAALPMPATPATAAGAAAPAQPVADPAAATRATARPTPLRRTLRQLVARPVLGGPRVATSVPAPALATSEAAVAPRRYQRHTALARTQESGLGRIALFFLAIFLGVLAGLGALVSLIPGVSFLGGVGLAAAGLLVLFLLYSLFSGGKNKKK